MLCHSCGDILTLAYTDLSRETEKAVALALAEKGILLLPLPSRPPRLWEVPTPHKVPSLSCCRGRSISCKWKSSGGASGSFARGLTH